MVSGPGATRGRVTMLGVTAATAATWFRPAHVRARACRSRRTAPPNQEESQQENDRRFSDA